MRLTISLAVALFPIAFAHAASVAPEKVDQIFAAYNAHSPGCSVGVIRDGGFLFRKSYGTASLELGVPLTPESVFYMASVSKQFTAASVVLAEQGGFLSLDDSVRKYIPELPEYSSSVTLRQMLHQTSGFRDFLALTDLSGRNTAALSSSSDVLKLIARQRGLNNPPGEKFVYSNSNYFLLGIVVKRATGKSLAQFAAANIFRPLGMTHTLFYDDNSVVVPTRVAAYAPAAGGKFRVDWSTIFDLVGSGGLLSNVDDLLVWDQNFHNGRLGQGKLREELERPGTLNSGGKINYGLGLWLSDYRGLKTVEHSGGTFGYRTELLRFPDQKFSAVVLCNSEDADVEGYARRIADLYLDGQLKPEPTVTAGSNNFSDPAAFEGTYLDGQTHVIYTFKAVNGNLMAWGATLKRVSANQFSDLVGNPITFTSRNGTMAATLTLQGETYFSGSKVSDVHLREDALRGLAGDYYSDELEATYRLSLVDGALMLTNGSDMPLKLIPITSDEFQAGDIGTVVFALDSNKHVPSMTLFSQRAGGIHFAKK